MNYITTTGDYVKVAGPYVHDYVHEETPKS
jgi:hypothetical protein